MRPPKQTIQCFFGGDVTVHLATHAGPSMKNEGRFSVRRVDGETATMQHVPENDILELDYKDNMNSRSTLTTTVGPLVTSQGRKDDRDGSTFDSDKDMAF
uniref:Uncharacterized protein n=1 Tax=Timema tahoe TaxID=61484 RepID=A0A7R9FFC1_9NEOP|nr:unnamed protein product [Timema tahoe]